MSLKVLNLNCRNLQIPCDESVLYLARLKNGSGFAVLSGRFQRNVAFRVPVKHPEEVVIGACHYDTEEEQSAAKGY